MYKDEANEWFKEAQEELERARKLRSFKDYKGAAFHLHQCVEKAMKAFLLKNGRILLRTHDLQFLASEVEKYGVNLNDVFNDLLELSKHYSAARYPNARHRLGLSDEYYTERLVSRLIETSLRILERLRDPPRFGFNELGRSVDDIIDRYVRNVRSRIKLHLLIVLGSRARGDYKPSSDIDVVVVGGDLPKSWWSILKEPLIDPRAYTPEEFLDSIRRLDPTVLDAIAEGVVIYDDGFLAEAKQVFERVVKEFRLVKEKLGWRIAGR